MLNTKEMRIDILKMALAAKSLGAHLGGSLSLVEIMAVLYGDIMKYDPKDMFSEQRDRLILSKGHGVMAQYAALKQVGLITEDQIITYKKPDSVLSAHPSINLSLGIEYSSGSLGMGLSLGVGAALGLRRKGNNCSRVFVILGDGECNEGSIWEAALSASHYKLNNIAVIVDKNSLQYDGPTEEIMSLNNFENMWASFGWDTKKIDGHNENLLMEALNFNSDKPLAIIAQTVKGKGVSFMENNPSWHHNILSQKTFNQAIEEIH